MANQVTVTNDHNVSVSIEPPANVQVNISRAVIGTVANVASANYANFAGTVVNASQPNITSVGTLGNLTVSGNVTANNFVGNFIGSVSNANYANYSNIANTANSVAVANVVGIGNIATVNLDGNSGNILYGNGTFAAPIVVNNVANANYANFAGTAYNVSGANVSGEVANANYATYTNIANTANAVAGANVSGVVANANYASYSNIANTANAVAGANVVGEVANANYASYSNIANTANTVAGANVTGTVANANFAAYAGNITNSAQPNITSVGTLTGLTVNGNVTANYFLGNVQGNISGNIVVPGNNTSVLFNQLGNAGASDAFQFDYSANLLRVDGNINSNGGVFNGNGAGLTNIAGANVTGTVANANFASFSNVANTANAVAGANVSGIVANANFASYSNIANTANSVAGANVSGEVANANFASFSNVANTANAVAGANVTGTVANANFASYSNIANTANAVAGANVSGEVANANFASFSNVANTANAVAGANVTGTVANANYASYANTVIGSNQSNITTLGNLTGLTVSGDASVSGNLSIGGNLSYVNVQNLYVVDPVIELGGGPNNAPLTTNDGKDRGTLLHYYTTQPIDAFMGWDNSNGEFGFGSNVTNANDVMTFNTYGNVRANTFIGNLSGDITGNANYASYANIANTANAVAGANVSGVVANANFASYSNIANTANAVAGANVSGVVANANFASYSNIANTANAVAGANVSGEVANANYASYSNIANTANAVAGANVSGTVANANYASYANIANTANSVAVANVVGIGNIATINLDGNASNILYGNGTFAPPAVVSNVANANYANFAGTAYSVSGANVTGIVANANFASYSNIANTANAVAGANVSGEVANANYASYANIANTANSVAVANVSGIGNIATINLDGNASNILYGNGAFSGLPTTIANANYANFAGTAYSVSGANVTGEVANANYASYSNIANTANTVAGANVTGTVANANYASYSNIANTANTVAGANVTGEVAYANMANYAGNITVNSQPNITSVGTLSNLAVSGNITANVITANYINANINFGNVDSIQFDTAANVTLANVGQLAWDDGDGTLQLLMKGGNVIQQIGTQEYARVYNDEATTLNKGEVVYINGAQGNRVSVKRAQANSETTSVGTIGFVAESIAAGAEGFIIVSGALYKLNTLGLTAGGAVYLSPSVAGGYTQTKPVAPDQLVVLGWIERVNATVGSIYVKVDNGYELDELHNVLIANATTGQALVYNSSNLWVNGNPNVANFAGNVTNAAQPNITSVGTLTSLNMGGNITANANITYDIGNSTNRFKDIWLANSTIYIGNANLKADDSNNTFNISVTGLANAVLVGNSKITSTTGNFAIVASNTTNTATNYFIPSGNVVNAISTSNIANTISVVHSQTGSVGAGSDSIGYLRSNGNLTNPTAGANNSTAGRTVHMVYNGNTYVEFARVTPAATQAANASFTSASTVMTPGVYNIRVGSQFGNSTGFDNTTFNVMQFSQNGRLDLYSNSASSSANFSNMGGILNYIYSNNATDRPNWYTGRHRGTGQTPQAVQASDDLFQFNIYGNSGNSVQNGAQIKAVVSSNATISNGNRISTDLTLTTYGGILTLDTANLAGGYGTGRGDICLGSGANLANVFAGNIFVGNSQGNQKIVLYGNGDMVFGNGNSVIYPNGAFSLANSNVQLKVDGEGLFGAGNIVLYANGTVSANTGSFTDLTATANGNIGNLKLNKFQETVYAYGNANGTITPDFNNGSIQNLTLDGNITLNTLGNAIAGRSMTLILTQDGTGNRLLTSNMLYAGGSKTLSTAASAKDIISVFYDGTNYFATLSKGYA